MNNELPGLAAWDLPDSDICSAAWQLAFDVSPEFIANHCARSYVFARELAAADGLRSGTDYDDELVFLTCLLHDLGVTDYGGGDQRFEVDGADAAVRLLRDNGVAEDRATTVWQAIALHTSVGLAQRFGAEHSVAFSGISLDINGLEKDRLPGSLVDRINTTWPRHDLGYAIAGLIGEGTKGQPAEGAAVLVPRAHSRDRQRRARGRVLDLVGWGDRPATNAATSR